LHLHASERTFGFSFDGAQSPLVEIQQIVRESEPGVHPELADGNSAPAGEIDFLSVLHDPPGVGQLGVD
jgi:hypothetical protein